MADFQNTIDLLGDEEVTKRLIEGTITEFNDNVITKAGDNAFYYSNLTSVNLPNATTFGKNAFGYSQVTNVNLPLASSFGQSSFMGCDNLTSLALPSFRAVNGSIRSCSKLKVVDLAKATLLMGYCLDYCSVLDTVILRSSTLCSNGGSDVLRYTLFDSGKAGGTLIVPRSLTASYPTATNWSALFANNPNNRVLALEDYTVDGTITGEIDWDKLGGTT